MPRILVSLPEVAAAITMLPTVDLDGVPHVDAETFVDAMVALGFATLGQHTPRLVEPALGIGDADVGSFLNGKDDEYETERARLAALPPGPCVGCGHVHPDAACALDAGGNETCPCDDYVDKTVRDPRQVALDSRGQGVSPDAAPITPLPHVEPTVDTRARPASNANAFRPASG